MAAAAEELLLKSGQKIVGTVVGYQDDMFRVETEFGFALIRKDSVESINFSAGPKRDANKKPDKVDTVKLAPSHGGAVHQSSKNPAQNKAGPAPSPTPAPQAAHSSPSPPASTPTPAGPSNS